MNKKETKQQQTHRYYLHRRVKQFTTVSAKNKQVNITNSLLAAATTKQKQYLSELKQLGYNLQFVIPE